MPSEQPTVTKPGLIVAVLAASGIAVSLTHTLVVPIIGLLPSIFDTTAATASWIITITLLTGAVSTPVFGRLADMYGKKQMMLVALLPFLIGSVICALASDVLVMIIGRGLQGLATGLIPLGISLIHDLLPKEKTGSAIALMSSSMGIGGALGLPFAAAVAQFADWRFLFWVTAAVALAVTLAIWLIIPRVKVVGSGARFDFLGAIGLAIGLVALLLGVSKGADWGWGSALTLGSVAVGLIVLLIWGWYELRGSAPLVNLRTAAHPVVLMTNISSILVGFTMYAMNLVLPQVMQLPVETGYGLGQSMLQMGLWMIPMGLGMMLVSGLGARLSAARGPRVTLTTAGVVIALGYGLTALILLTLGNRTPGAADGGQLLLTLILFSASSGVVGVGTGLGYGAMPALILGSVPATEKASSNSVNSLMRSLGTTSSAAVIGAVLAVMMRDGIPTQAGFLIAVLISTASALIAAIVAYFIPARARIVAQQG